MRRERMLNDFSLGILGGIGISLIIIGAFMRWMSRMIRKESK